MIRAPRAGSARLLGLSMSLVALGLAVAALVIGLRAGHGSSGSQGACPIPTIADRELPSIVTISVTGPTGSGTGSGEIIDSSGHVLTNNHVISAAAARGTIVVT